MSAAHIVVLALQFTVFAGSGFVNELHLQYFKFGMLHARHSGHRVIIMLIAVHSWQIPWKVCV